MTLFKVGVGIYVTADEIVMLQTYPSRPARRDKQAAEAAGLYKDATTTGKKRETLRTLVHLRCGLLVGSPVGADALAARPAMETPAKLTSRRNNLENAQVVNGDNGADNGQLNGTPIERPQNAPRGQKFGDGGANPNGTDRAAPVEPVEAPPQVQGEEAEPSGLFARLLGRTDTPR